MKMLGYNYEDETEQAAWSGYYSTPHPWNCAKSAPCQLSAAHASPLFLPQYRCNFLLTAEYWGHLTSLKTDGDDVPVQFAQVYC